MELRHLRYFVAVAETENVSKAAIRLHISQPPLSRQIRELEDMLGVQLFYRIGKSIRLTEPGRILLKSSKLILTQIEQMTEAVQKADGKAKRHLHLGYVPSLSANILPKVLGAFKAQAPLVRITLHDMTHEEMVNGLRKRQLDAAFLGRYQPSPIPGIKFDRLGTFRAGVLVFPGHRFAANRSIALADVRSERLILFSRQQYAVYFNWVRRLFGSQMRTLKIEDEVDSGSSMIAAVKSERGIAICTEGHAKLAGSRTRFIPFHPPQPPVEIGIAYPAQTVLSLQTRQFIATANAHSRRLSS